MFIQGMVSLAVSGNTENSIGPKAVPATPAQTQGLDATGIVKAVVPPVDQPTRAENFKEAVHAAAKQIDSYLKSVGREFEFRVDEQSNITIVTVRETATGQVIRQIPNEEVLHLARSLSAGNASALVSLKI